jgi:peroxiredoxin Q/BCP
VYGISRDTVQSHQKFASKYHLNMPLLSDPDGTVCDTYGVLKEKNMYGKVSVGIERTTYVIDQSGKIAEIFHKVKVDGHAEAVLDVVKRIAGV